MNSALLQKGALLALVTALISGVAVFINSFGVKQVPDPFVFTTTKNLLVALTLGALILLPASWNELKLLTRRQWLSLAVIGMVGGSVPFLLFFYGLKEATAPSAAFIHKTLFIWVAILAYPILKERLGKLQLVALAVLVLGQLVLVGRPSQWALGRAEFFVLLATLLWAVEAIIAKKVMSDVSARVAALGRMGFGAVIMLAFLASTGRVEALVAMTGVQWMWVAITSVFLLGYVVSYYGALKHAPVTVVASVLVLGSVITSLLHAMFNARTYTPEQVVGFGLIIAASALWLFISTRFARSAGRSQEVSYARR